MIKRIVISLVLFILLFVSNAYAVDFSYSARIENGGSKKYKAIRITPKIYNNINANMADLVLYDENNEPVPYFITALKKSNRNAKKLCNETCQLLCKR